LTRFLPAAIAYGVAIAVSTLTRAALLLRAEAHCGAHFVSHALWTAWIAWAVNLALYLALKRAGWRT
jgi:membrane-associated PAP2 superfamily phosphatase